MKLVKVAYGDDADQKSFQQTQGLMQAYPDLKGIISPTTVGIAAVALASGRITGAEGEKFEAGRLGEYTVGKDGEVVLGKPTVFDRGNIDRFDF